MSRLVKVALLQTKCVPNKSLNLGIIESAFQEASKSSPKICVLGEIVNSPYEKKYMQEFAESFDNSETLDLLKRLSKEHQVYTITSIPQRVSPTQLFNTGVAISPKGELIAKMRKLHLFDIDIPGKITYKESDTYQPGDEVCVFDTQYCKIGLSICYDLRFAELGLLMRQRGAMVLVYPGSFNQTTGPLHWELLLRGRAVDNQCYSVGVSTARSKDNPQVYQAYGHSLACDPFGRVLTSCSQDPEIQFFDINLDYVQQVRQQIPISKQKRTDIYTLVDIKAKKEKTE